MKTENEAPDKIRECVYKNIGRGARTGECGRGVFVFAKIPSSSDVVVITIVIAIRAARKGFASSSLLRRFRDGGERDALARSLGGG